MTSVKPIACAFLLALPMLTLNAHAGQFKRATYYPAGHLPYRVVATELTNSGNVDLAIADWLSNKLVVLLGDGDGTFQKPLEFSVPSPISLAAGDFNEDGNQDLAVVEGGGTGNGAIAIFLGDGKGGFKLSGSNPIGKVSVSVALADFNGDGHLDVAVANKQGSVMTFFGNGRGKLRDRKTYKMKSGPFGITAADLNGDHHPDLAVTDVNRGNVIVMMNDGTGKFQQPVTYSVGGGEAVDVKIADLRSNGSQDLVVANISQGMVVLLNKGDGTFEKATIYRMCSGCLAADAVAIADFNLDGNPDIAVASQSGNSALFHGNGKGKFKPAIAIKDPIGNDGGYSIAAGDFNHDNAPDLAIPIQNKGKVAVMLNKQ